MADLPEPDEPEFTPWAEHTSTFSTSSSRQVAIRRGVVDHPFRIDGSGNVAMVYDAEAVAVEIRTILGIAAATPTGRGEVEWDPELGSVVDRLRHMPDDAATKELVKYYVVDCLTKYVPSISLRSVTIDVQQQDTGVAMLIYIVYDIPALSVKDVSQVVEA
jgi:phage baseplate assembly protein W